MATPTTYTYSLSLDAPGGAVNPDKLSSAIRLSAIVVALDSISTDDEADLFSIAFRDVLSAEDREILDGGDGAGDTDGAPSDTHPAGGLIASTDNTPNPPAIAPVQIVGDDAGGEFDEKTTTVGGVGTGDFAPTSNRAPRVVDTNQRAPLNLDAEGQLMNRGPTLTDEGSFRDDFPGSSLNRGVTGTVTLEADSLQVIGVGTSFLDEIDRNTYLRVVGDDEDCWVLVARVVSDTRLEIDEAYSGELGAGQSIEATFWPTATGSGGSVSVSGGKVNVASGTTQGSRTRIWREGDYMPMALTTCLDVSQRLDETTIVVGWKDDPDDPHSQALLVFDGTDRTKVKLRSSCGPDGSEIEENQLSMPLGMRTDVPLIFQLALTAQGFFVSILYKGESFQLDPNRRHIPGPYDDLRIVVEAENTETPGSSTTVAVDVLVLENHNTVAIGQPNRAHSVPVVVRDDVPVRVRQERLTCGHYKPIPVKIPVPTGKVRYKDIIVPGLSGGYDWMDLDFYSGDVASGDAIVCGKGLLGVVGEVAAAADAGATTIFVASSPGILASTRRNGALDEGFYLSFGVETATDEDLNTAADESDPGDDNNPDAELREHMILRLADQNDMGVAEITLDTPLEDAVAQGTPVNLVVRVIDSPVEVTKDKHYHFGGQVFESGSLPAGTRIRFGYRNNSQVDETVRAELHTLY